jgi:histidine triad (HIT) family protein
MDNCLFCRIIRGEIPASKVYEDDTTFAFRDISPQAPTHILVVPKTHVASIADVTEVTVLSDVMKTATAVAKSEGLTEKGYRLVTNHGDDGGQTVHHWHVHVLGGRQLQWPPG